MYNTIALEEMGKPAVTLTNQTYLIEDLSAASSKGMPGLRVVRDTIHSEDWIDEATDPARIKAGINPVLDNLIDALTRPLTYEESSPLRKEEEKPSRVIFKGDLEEVNRFLYRRGWADGLPLIPPTEEKVTEMLTGTDLPPDYVITKFGPRLGKATVEKIAINAVMAGALPPHMPVLIAGLQALADPASRFDTMQDSQGSWVPFWIINGPIRNDIRVNSGVGALSPGDIANAAIGRALELLIKNIGGIRKGIEDAGSFGNPGKYTMVIGENEEESPWEPYHVETGYKQEDSTVTLYFPNVFDWAMPSGVGAKGIIDPMVAKDRGRGLSCFLVPPGAAKIVADEGWTKRQIKEYFREKSRVPFSSLPEFIQATMPNIEPDDLIPLMQDLEGLMILVAGGPGGMYYASGARIQGQNFVTKQIRLPGNWEQLVAKYKNLVPIYAKY